MGLSAIQLRRENEIFKPEIIWEEGEAGKKGVSYQNVENIPHIEVIMIPQKSECNLDSLVEEDGRVHAWGENPRHVDTISRRHCQLQVTCPHKYWKVERNAQTIFMFQITLANLYNDLLCCYLDGMCQQASYIW